MNMPSLLMELIQNLQVLESTLMTQNLKNTDG